MVESTPTDGPQEKITGEFLIGKVLGFRDPTREDQYRFACSVRENFLDTPLDQIPPHLRPMIVGLGELEEGILKNVIAPVYGIEDDREKEFFYRIMRPDPTSDIKKLKCVGRVDTLLGQIENLMAFREEVEEMNPTSMETFRENVEKMSPYADADTMEKLSVMVDIFSTLSEEEENDKFLDSINEEITLTWAEIYKMMIEFYTLKGKVQE